jgi:hypothetical protein
VQIDGGEVRLNLISVAAQIIGRIAQSGVDALGVDATIPSIPPSLDASAAIGTLSSALGVTLPEDFGQVTILTVDQLREYQDTLRAAKRLVAISFALSLLLLAATLLVSVDRRRAIVFLGSGIAIALFLGGVFLRRIRGNIVDVISGPGAKAAAQSVLTQVGTSLRRTGLLVMAVALLAAFIAYLAGRPPWLQRVLGDARRLTAPAPGGSTLDIWVAGHADATRIVGAAVAALILFWTGVDWVPVAILAISVGLLLWGVGAAEKRVRSTPPGLTG